jgi:hypothetical protein
MISTTSVETLQIYCQNVGRKHNWTINLSEQMKSRFDILFLQEPPWATVRYTTSLTEKDRVPVKGPPIHPDWISLYPKRFDLAKDQPHVLAYVNHAIRLIKPKLCSNIVNYRNVMIVTVRGHLGPLHLMNMYSDENGSAIQYIKDHLEVFLDLGYMGGEFNCPSSHWDATVLCGHPMATRLMECATSLNMERVAPPLGQVTHLLYNAAIHGSILNLMFFPIYWGYMANLTIGDKGEPNHFWLLLDVPLKVFWLEGKMSIKANSEEEADFLGKVIISLGQIPIPDVMSVDQTQAVAQAISKVFDSAWTHHARAKWACAHSKSWWDMNCNRAKASAMSSDLPAEWMAFKKATCKAKCKHFDEHIEEIAHTNL